MKVMVLPPLNQFPSVQETIATIRYYALLRKNPPADIPTVEAKAREFFEVGLVDKTRVSNYYPSKSKDMTWAQLGFEYGLQGLGISVSPTAQDTKNYRIGVRVGRIVRESEIQTGIDKI